MIENLSNLSFLRKNYGKNWYKKKSGLVISHSEILSKTGFEPQSSTVCNLSQLIHQSLSKLHCNY